MSTQYASAHQQREAGPGGGLRRFEVSHGAMFRERVRMSAQSEYALRTELENSRPEWFPVAIVEVES